MRNNTVKKFEFGPVVQEEMSFKRFLIWSSGGPPVPWSQTIFAILKEGIMGNSHVKLYEIWTGGSVKKSLQTTDTQQTKTDHNSSSCAFGSGELKIRNHNKYHNQPFQAYHNITRRKYLSYLFEV